MPEFIENYIYPQANISSVRLPQNKLFSLGAVFLLLALLLVQTPSASGGYIDKYKLAIGDRWNYAVEYWNHTFYVDYEVIDEGIISSFNQVREVYVINVDYFFGDIKATELPVFTYDINFHQKQYVNKETFEIIRIESFLNGKITYELVEFNPTPISYGGNIKLYLKQLDDMNYLTGNGFPIEKSGNVIQNINQKSFIDGHYYEDVHLFGGIFGDSIDLLDSVNDSTTYQNKQFYTGQKDIRTPAGNF